MARISLVTDIKSRCFAEPLSIIVLRCIYNEIETFLNQMFDGGGSGGTGGGEVIFDLN
jgi:hypothetical protein